MTEQKQGWEEKLGLLLADAESIGANPSATEVEQLALNAARFLSDIKQLEERVEKAEAQAKVDLWECTDCGFAFDAFHEDVAGGHSCPVCAEVRLESQVKRLRKAAEAYRDLCKHYRVGANPSDALFKRLDRANEALAQQPTEESWRPFGSLALPAPPQQPTEGEG